MPSNRIHCAISKKRTGHTFEELHRWMDEPYEKFGINHRKERHFYNEKDEKEILEYWNKNGSLGEKAVVEWLFHIALDNLWTAFEKSHHVYSDNAYNYYKIGLHESKYIDFDFDHISEDELKKKFDEKSFNDSFEKN
jgi:hypothetical protein